MKENTKQQRRVRSMILLAVFIAIFISVATYAWFVGMRTVHVTQFDIEIAGTEDLQLSLNGKDWSDTVSIHTLNYNDPTVVYSDNTNWWAGRGLIPVSTVGDIDQDSSRLIMYEKSSLTASTGGYRLMTSQVPNDGPSEVDGYVAFDLFVRNFTGSDYIPGYNIADEEAIYLATDSLVTVAEGGVAGTGIENSARVAFAQIGRVIGTTADKTGDDPTDAANVGIITGINCNGVKESYTLGEDVTRICRTADIWEPNDVRHVAAALDWYEKSCKDRTDGTYGSGNCKQLQLNDVTTEDPTDYLYYPTFAVSREIDSSEAIDVYDGSDYNNYTGNTGAGKALRAFPYFTDTKKMQTGVARQPIFTLAPNSVTKIRVYVYIEGQDIDNYDYAQIGKSIAVNFGFTKQRFTKNDIDEAPAMEPIITLNGGAMEIEVGSDFDYKSIDLDDPDWGASAVDAAGATINERIFIGGYVDVNKVGKYVLTYRVTDKYGVSAAKTRVVTVKLPTTP